ncbi:aldehyde dehydrogenase family protein, partial [Stenotrophomonas maltophilia]|uniref:aldehyde dehydrogenase family protein n=1 Tax=Stenotrophomonas maltophilia TaxID=40324 RepID=UPI0013DBD0EC
YKKRAGDMAEAISREMGAPMSLAKSAHVGAGLGHLAQALEVLKTYEFDEMINKTMVTREPVGVVGLITPWN